MSESYEYDKEEIQDAVDCEGLGYVISYGIRASDIADPKLAGLWAEAVVALERVEDCLYDRSYDN